MSLSFLPVKWPLHLSLAVLEAAWEENQWWCLHKSSYKHGVTFLFFGPFWEVFLSLPALEVSPAKWAAIRVTSAPSHLLRGQSFPAGPLLHKSQASFVRGLPVDSPPCPLRMGPSWSCRWKCNKASIPSGNSGQRHQEDVASPQVTNRIISFMGNEPAQQQGSCHLVDISWCGPVLPVLPPKCRFQFAPFHCFRSPCSGALTCEHCSHQSPVSSPHHPFFWPVWSVQPHQYPTTQTFRGYCSHRV